MTTTEKEPEGSLNTRHVRVSTPLGDVLIAGQPDAVVGLYFDGQKHLPPRQWFGPDDSWAPTAVLRQTATELSEYFEGHRHTFDVPVRPVGTPFQQRVWELLRAIPYGQTTTYGALAGRLSPDTQPSSGLAQGVGQAVGHNPVSVIVPCHRVLGADGSLTGFAGGLDRKRWLLAHEEPADINETRLF